MSFGRELRKIRMSKQGLTLDKLSESTGLSKGYLSKLENDKRGVPKVETVKKIARGLDISYYELLKKAGYAEESDKLFKDSLQKMLNRNYGSGFLEYIRSSLEELETYDLKTRTLLENINLLNDIEGTEEYLEELFKSGELDPKNFSHELERIKRLKKELYLITEGVKFSITKIDLHRLLNHDFELYYKDRLLTEDDKDKIAVLIDTILR